MSQNNKYLYGVKTKGEDMLFIRRIIWAILVCSMFNVGCSNDEEKLSDILNYEQATEMATQYVIASGYYKEGEFKILNEPNNATWNWYSSRAPEMSKDFGLNDKKYYAIYFYVESVRDGDTFIFVDRDEKRIIGAFYNREFEKNFR